MKYRHLADACPCANCGVSFRPRKDRVKDVNFCSRGCAARYHVQHPSPAYAIWLKGKPRQQMSVICGWCKKGFVIAPWRLRRGQTVIYCSMSCKNRAIMTGRTGPENGNWKGGISIYPRIYRDARKQALERDNYQCQGAEPHGKRLEIHHVDGNKHNSDLGNLLTLCSKCHKMAHRYCT